MHHGLTVNKLGHCYCICTAVTRKLRWMIAVLIMYKIIHHMVDLILPNYTSYNRGIIHYDSNSRDHKGVGVAQKIISPAKKQPQFPRSGSIG